jgi:hypothetical protein
MQRDVLAAGRRVRPAGHGEGGLMAQSIIVLHVVLPPTERADEILAATANRLDIERITPDHHGRAQLWMQMRGRPRLIPRG